MRTVHQDSQDATRMAHEEADDELLLQRVVGGDGDAFAALVRRHTDLVHAVCWRVLRDPADTQDAVQETFIAVYRGAATFSGSARFTTWLYRVATNTCHDLLRKRVRRPRSAGVDPEWLPTAAADELGAAELDLDLRRALGSLRAEHREVVVLHSVVGLSYAEIADRTGVALGTVKSRIHRAHGHLARLLDPGLPDGEASEPSDPGIRQGPVAAPPEPEASAR